MDQRQANHANQQSVQDKQQPSVAQTSCVTEPSHPVFQLQRAIGNRALGLLLQAKLTSCADCESENKEAALQMKQAGALPVQSHTASENQSRVMQLQSDTTPPVATPESSEEEAAAEQQPSQEFPDFGEGVASIEQGTYGAPGEGQSEENEETSAPVQTKGEGSAGNHPPVVSPQTVLNDLGSGGPIDASLRNRMEGSFNESFADVRLHTHQRAHELSSALGAQAFTIGNHIAFASARYRPDTTEGTKLIAHELTHVIQQRRGVSGALLQRGIGSAGDEYELEADRKADEIVGQDHKTTSRDASPEAESSQKQSGPGSSSAGAIQLFSGSAAASYASKWALSTNSAYGRFDNDCTNFASQAMEAGGWTMLTGSGYCDDRKEDYVWWFKPSGCVYGVCPWSWCPDVKTVNASYTWGGAQNFFDFVKSSGRGTSVAKVSDLVVGDILQMDFGGGGHIGHTMVVTKKTAGNIYLSYHTSDHLDEPFWPDGSNTGILDRNKSAYYYGWSIK